MGEGKTLCVNNYSIHAVLYYYDYIVVQRQLLVLNFLVPDHGHGADFLAACADVPFNQSAKPTA
jgi:hypothetical protein